VPEDSEPKRNANGESTIYLGKDGKWHGRVTMGTKPDGSEDRRHREGKTQAIVERKVRALEKARDSGKASKPGRKPTVEQWMVTYLTTIAPLKVKPRTLDDYWSKARNDIIPGIGKHRIDKLQVDHLDELYLALREQGHAQSHVLKVHRIISRALKIAHRRGLVGENVATLIDAPTVDEVEMSPLTRDEALAVLEAVKERRNALRWAVAITMGLRQGEALGLRWKYVDLDKGEARIHWQLQRLGWKHGCDDAHACGQRLHKLKPCPKNCRIHASYKRGCPKPCPAGCVAHASTCPTRHGGGLVFTEPKSGSKRTVPIPPPLVDLLREHQKWLANERTRAGSVWEDFDLLFCQPTGRPIDPRDDWEEFKEILGTAGVDDHRVHDARHTSGTELSELDVDMDDIMAILGHTDARTTKRYVHRSSRRAKEAMRLVGEAYWPSAPEAATEKQSTRAARRRQRRRNMR